MKKQIVAVVLTAVWLIEAFDGPVITRAELQPIVRKSERTEASVKRQEAPETALSDYLDYLSTNFEKWAEEAINGRRSDEDTAGETVDIGAIETGAVDSDPEEYIPEPEPDCEESGEYVEEPEPDCESYIEEVAPEPSLTYMGEWTVSFYDLCPECTGPWYGMNTTASGNPPIPWYTVATSSDIPFGTILYIEGFGTFEVMDRGVGSAWVDILVNNHSEIPSYGITTASVYIVN